MDTDSSSYYETTYSEDERIERALRKEKRICAQQATQIDLARKESFDHFYKSEPYLFALPAIKFHTFRHLKIKFSFHPASIKNFVNQNVRFYVSLKYVSKYWRVKRDSVPANYKWKIYNLFYNNDFFVVDDENIFTVINKIYEILVGWTQKEEKFRLGKYEKYKKGEEVELDSDDEQLFLNQSERIALYQKRLKVLKRMLPPARH